MPPYSAWQQHSIPFHDDNFELVVKALWSLMHILYLKPSEDKYPIRPHIGTWTLQAQVENYVMGEIHNLCCSFNIFRLRRTGHSAYGICENWRQVLGWKT